MTRTNYYNPTSNRNQQLQLTPSTLNNFSSGICQTRMEILEYSPKPHRACAQAARLKNGMSGYRP